MRKALEDCLAALRRVAKAAPGALGYHVHEGTGEAIGPVIEEYIDTAERALEAPLPTCDTCRWLDPAARATERCPPSR